MDMAIIVLKFINQSYYKEEQIIKAVILIPMTFTVERLCGHVETYHSKDRWLYVGYLTSREWKEQLEKSKCKACEELE